MTSADADYATLDVAAVAVTVADDDVAAVIVEPALLRVAEGGTVVYTVVLASRPTAPVIVTPASGDTGAATVSGALTFGPDDWDEAQKVTVGGVDDDDVADESTRIAHAVTSADADYATLDVAAVAVTVADDDVAAVIVEPALLRVAEGGTVVYTVVLASRPTAPVIVTPASGDTGAATVSGALTFGPDDWDEAQKVTVGGVDDDDVADESTRIAHAVTSADADYATLDVAAVAVTVADDDVAAVIVEPALLRVAEGGTVVYTVVLASRPTAPVIVTPASGDTGAATVSGALTFGPDDWDEAQKVTVGGVDDDDVADESTRIAHAVTSADADYATLDVAAVAVTVADDDVAAVIVEPALLRVAEGGTVVYTVVLASRPTAPVIVTPASGDTGAATVSGALTFGPDDWDEAQKVTVGGVDDDDVADESTRIAPRRDQRRRRLRHAGRGGGRCDRRRRRCRRRDCRARVVARRRGRHRGLHGGPRQSPDRAGDCHARQRRHRRGDGVGRADVRARRLGRGSEGDRRRRRRRRTSPTSPPGSPTP